MVAAPLKLVGLPALMESTEGRPEVVVGLVDGPVVSHPDLQEAEIREISRPSQATVKSTPGAAAQHGTYVAGILVARRNSRAPAICPGVTMVSRPLFPEPTPGFKPTAAPQDLAGAVVEVVDAGAMIVNLSVATAQPSTKIEPEVAEALDYAAATGCIVVAAAGNQGTLGSAAITRHPWVIPVAAYGLDGRPRPESNLGGSLGRHGVGGPGEGVVSLKQGGGYTAGGGTSTAAPYVTGTIALLLSIFPRAAPAEIRAAVLDPIGRRTGASVVPPLLNAEAARNALGNLGRRCPV